jgi:hypothetical protein
VRDAEEINTFFGKTEAKFSMQGTKQSDQIELEAKLIFSRRSLSGGCRAMSSIPGSQLPGEGMRQFIPRGHRLKETLA